MVTRARSTALAALALFVPSCQRREAYAYRVQIVETVGLGVDLDGAHLVVDGVDLGTLQISGFNPRVGEATMTMPPDRLLANSESRLRAPTPCGVLDVPLSASELGETRARDECKEVCKVELFASESSAPPRHQLLLDNGEGTAAVEVGVGALAIAIGAGATRVRDVLPGDCEPAPDIAVAGVSLGVLGASPDRATLVDVAGGHCYAVVATLYGDWPGAPPPARAIVGARGGPRVHDVPRIEDFLVGAPTFVDDASVSGLGLATRLGLQRVPCP